MSVSTADNPTNISYQEDAFPILITHHPGGKAAMAQQGGCDRRDQRYQWRPYGGGQPSYPLDAKRLCTCLPGGPPAIDENCLARDKGRCAGGKKYAHARHIHWVTNSVKR